MLSRYHRYHVLQVDDLLHDSLYVGLVCIAVMPVFTIGSGLKSPLRRLKGLPGQTDFEAPIRAAKSCKQ